MGKKFDDIVYYTRRTVDRRWVADTRFFRKQEYLDYNPERRVKIRRQNMGDRLGAKIIYRKTL